VSDHSILAPSHAETWIGCAGSIAMSAGLPDDTTSYAEEGTRAHTMAARILKGERWAEADLEMLSYVKVYTDAVLRAAEGKILLVEKSVAIEAYTSEPGGKGTSDAIIADLEACQLEVHDLKYGMGHIVEAENNKQLMLYALGALDLVGDMLGVDFATVKLVIHQPRRDHLSEWTVDVGTLRTFGAYALNRGQIALAILKNDGNDNTINDLNSLTPSEKACLWCKAKAICPALKKVVTDAVFADFEPMDEAKPKVRAVAPDLLYMVEEWVAAVHAFIYQQLAAGNELEDWKLVSGREGNRKWSDDKRVLKLASKLKIPKKSIIEPGEVLSPTKLKAVVPKDKWPQFEHIIVRNPAKMTHAPKYDKRESVTVTTADEFEAIPEEVDIFS
jgi:hypothetical protein